MPETAATGSIATYREVLAAPGARRLAVASLVSKFPISMFPVSGVLLMSPRYSYAEAGTAVGAMLLANAVSSPLRGRLAATGSGRVLRRCLAGYLAGLAGLVLAAAGRLPFGWVVLSVVTIGLCFPPVSILLRTHWTSVDRARGRSSANALESALMDVTLITGPVLATWLSTSLSPLLPFALIGALMAGAVVLLLTLHREPTERPGPPTGHWRAPLRSRPLRAVFGAQFLFCAALSATEVMLPVYAQQQHVASHSGWYLAGLSVGSIVGALGLGAHDALARTELPGLLAVFVSGCVLLGLAMEVAPAAVLLVCPLTGLAVGSTFARLFTAIGALTPPGCDSETQGWANSMTTVGFAAGASAGASLAGAYGAGAFLLLSPVAGGTAVLFALGGTAALAQEGGAD